MGLTEVTDHIPNYPQARPRTITHSIPVQTAFDPFLKPSPPGPHTVPRFNLHLTQVDLSRWFVEPGIRGPYTFGELLRGLDCIKISSPTLGRGGWSPLTNFLTHRAAVGKPISLLVLNDCPRMPPEVVESIKRVVDVLERWGLGMG